MNAMLDPAARVAASKRALSRAARERAAMAIAGTAGGAATARATRDVETITAGVRLVEMQDADPLASMGLSRRQVDAAEYLRGLWADCLPGYEAPMAYASGGNGKRHLSADQEAAAARAWFDYKDYMARLDGSAGLCVGNAVRGAVLRNEQAHPPHVRDGLDWLADHWRMVK
jgi:hypothetical protein